MGAAVFGTLDDGVHTRALDNSNTSRELTQAVMPMARMPGTNPSLGAGGSISLSGEKADRQGYRLWSCHSQPPAWNWGSDCGPWAKPTHLEPKELSASQSIPRRGRWLPGGRGGT